MAVNSEQWFITQLVELRMKQYFFHSFTSFEIIGQHKSGPIASVGQRGGGELKCTHSIPLPFETVTSHRQKLTCRVFKSVDSAIFTSC